MAPEENSLINQQNQSVKTQYNIASSFVFRNHPIRVGLVLAVILLSFVGFGVVHRYESYTKEKAVFANATIKSTVDGLKEFNDAINSIVQSYQNCEGVYSKGEFIFAREMNYCRDDVSSKLSAAQEVRSKYAPSMHAASLDLIDKLMKQNMQDFRDLSVNAYMTNSFEEEFVSKLVLLCSKNVGQQNSEWNSAIDSGLSDAIRRISDTMSFQNKEYYIIRDFVLPRLYSSREIVADAARTVGGLDSVKVLAQATASYQNLVEEQSKYSYKADKYPFQNGIMRSMQSRDFSSASSSPDGIKQMQQLEDTRSLNARAALPFMALRGRYEKAKRLVDCGILKPEFLKKLER